MSQQDIEFLKSLGLEIPKAKEPSTDIEFLRSLGLTVPVTPDPREAEDIPNFDNIIQALPESEIEIGAPPSKRSAFSWIARLIGAEQGVNDTQVSDSYQIASIEAGKAREHGGLFGNMIADKITRAQGQMLAGGAVAYMQDYVDRPRKAVINSLSIIADRRMQAAEGKSIDPLTFDDFEQVIIDAWNGEQHSRTEAAFRGILIPDLEVRYQRLLKRHPKFAKIANAREAIVELEFIFLTEIAVAKGIGLAGKGIGATLKVSKARYGDRLEDIITRTAKKAAIEAEGKDIITTLVTRLDEAPDIDLDNFTKFKGFRIKSPAGVTHPDDAIKSLVYKSYINDSIATADNASGWIEPKKMQDVIDAATFRNRSLEIIELDEPIVKTIKKVAKPTAETKTLAKIPRTARVISDVDEVLEARIVVSGGGFVPTIRFEFAPHGLSPDAVEKNIRIMIRDEYPGQRFFISKTRKSKVLRSDVDDFVYNVQFTRPDGSQIPHPDDFFDRMGLPKEGFREEIHFDVPGEPAKAVPVEEITEEVIQTHKAIPKKKSIKDLTFEELEDVALELDTIKDMQPSFRKKWLAQAGRSNWSISPPVRIFDNLGLGRQYSRVTSSIYNRKHGLNQSAIWYINARREFAKLTRKHSKESWTRGDNKVNRIWGRIMNASPQAEWPDDLIDVLDDTEIDFFEDLAQQNRDLFLDPWGEEGLRQGRMTKDPDLIAAGVAPWEENYYHNSRLNIVRSIEDRRAIDTFEGKNVHPLRWDVKDILKKDIKTDFEYGEFMARTASEDQINYYGIDVDMKAKSEILRMLEIEPELKRMNAAIEALPDGLPVAVKAEAKKAFAGWVKQIRHQPLPIDESLNAVFNAGSHQLESIFKAYEASEKAFTNFAITSNRLIDRGVLLGNIRPITRNPFQTQHTVHIFGPKASAWGMKALFTHDGQQLIKTSQTVMDRGIPLAMFDLTDPAGFRSNIRKIADNATYGGIMVTDKYINVSHAYLSGWHSYFSKNKRAWGDLVRHGKTIGVTENALRNEKFASTLTHALERGKFLDARRTIDFKGVALTQWLYDSEMASPLMRSMAAKMGLKYSTWQQNLFGGHLPTLMSQLMDKDTSKPLRVRLLKSFDPRKGKGGEDIFEMPATLAQRTAIFQAIAKIALASYLGKELGIDLMQLTFAGSVPSGRLTVRGRDVRLPAHIAPVIRGLAGVTQLGTEAIEQPTGTVRGALQLASRDILNALGQMQYGKMTENEQLALDGYRNFIGALIAHVPGSGLTRKIQAVREGKLPPSGILWPAGRTSKPATSRTAGKLGIKRKGLGIKRKDIGL